MIKLLCGIILAVMIPVVGTILTDAPAIWPVSTLIYTLGLLFCFALMPRKAASVISFNVLAGSFFLVESAFFLSYYLQNAGFNGAFFYHLNPDLFYAGVSEHLSILLVIIFCLIGFLVLSTLFITKERFDVGRKMPVALGLILTGLFLSPPARALVDYAGIFSGDRADEMLIRNFPELKDTKVAAKFTASQRPNLVLIYAESLEQRYFDEAIFPNLLPNLKRLRDESIDFTNVAQGIDAGWTIAGIVASQCGYPLSGPLGVRGNDLAVFGDFLPKATCLGDLLAKDGFDLSFVGGADADFAGKGAFLKSHGFSEVLGNMDLYNSLTDKTYVNAWGIFDDSMFEFAAQKFNRMSESTSPFLLTVLTLDTHLTSGLLSRSCGPYEEGDNSTLNAFHCSDRLIADFVEHIRTSPYSDNTIIIVVSDHLAMRNEATALIEASKVPQRLTFFINTPQGRKETYDHPGLHYDIAPTILDLVGYNITGQMGFGRSLLRGAGYLPARFNEEELAAQSDNLRAIGSRLWEDRVILGADGITFTISDLTMTMGGRDLHLRAGGHLDIPSSAILFFDENTLELKEIKLHPIEHLLKQDALISQMLKHSNELVLAISRAKNLVGFSDPRIHPEQWVYYCGKPGSAFLTWGPISSDFMIPFRLIKEMSQSQVDDKVINERRRMLNAVQKEVSQRREG